MSEYCKNCYELQQQLDQLKAENIKFTLDTKNLVAQYSAKLKRLKKTLTDIKEITEIEIECKTYEIENDCFNETRCKTLNEHIDFIKQILQKIKECEAKDEN